MGAKAEEDGELRYYLTKRVCYNARVKTIKILFLVLVTALVLSGCSIVKEGVTGERPDGGSGDAAEGSQPSVPAAFPIEGNWFGVYGGSEYLALSFSADGKCELQPALYPSDFFGPKYYGDYTWGGEYGNEIALDMYMGESVEVIYDGGVRDEWSDGGRDNATAALSVTFRVYGGSMKSLAFKAVAAGYDTEGYAVVQSGAFFVIMDMKEAYGGNSSPFIFASTPYDMTEGKVLRPAGPDGFLSEAERLYTTADLNVRCGPGTEYATYGTVPEGTPVDKIGTLEGKGDWVFVLLEDGGGWCNVGYLTDTRPPAA